MVLFEEEVLWSRCKIMDWEYPLCEDEVPGVSQIDLFCYQDMSN